MLIIPSFIKTLFNKLEARFIRCAFYVPILKVSTWYMKGLTYKSIKFSTTELGFEIQNGDIQIINIFV